MTEEQRLLAEARYVAHGGSELALFNAMRAELLGGKPPTPEARIPMLYTGVGGDIEGNW